MIEFFAAAGGLFALLSFIHFFGDWLFQSQYEAVNKSKNWKVRAIHCTVYTLFFVPVLAILGTSGFWFLTSVAILWISHFIIDTYIPVVLWAKYLRKIETLNPNKKKFWSTPIAGLIDSDGQKTFIELWGKPVYPILFIAVDQILHLTFLWPVVLIILIL